MVQDCFRKWTTAEYKKGEEKGLLGDLLGYFWLLPFLWLDYGETETWLSVVWVYLSIFLLTLSSWAPNLSLSLPLSLPPHLLFIYFPSCDSQHLLLQKQAKLQQQIGCFHLVCSGNWSWKRDKTDLQRGGGADKRLYETISLSYLSMLLTLHFHSSVFLPSLLQLSSLRKAIDFSPISLPRSLLSASFMQLLVTHTETLGLSCRWWKLWGDRECLHRMHPVFTWSPLGQLA